MPGSGKALVVQKYGGTSVGDVERIRNVARRALAGPGGKLHPHATARRSPHLFQRELVAREHDPHGRGFYTHLGPRRSPSGVESAG